MKERALQKKWLSGGVFRAVNTSANDSFGSRSCSCSLLLNGQAPGKEILHPVAIVIFGGLISSTLLDTLLTPVIFWKLGEEKITKALED